MHTQELNKQLSKFRQIKETSDLGSLLAQRGSVKAKQPFDKVLLRRLFSQTKLERGRLPQQQRTFDEDNICLQDNSANARSPPQTDIRPANGGKTQIMSATTPRRQSKLMSLRSTPSSQKKDTATTNTTQSTRTVKSPKSASTISHLPKSNSPKATASQLTNQIPEDGVVPSGDNDIKLWKEFGQMMVDAYEELNQQFRGVLQQLAEKEKENSVLKDEKERLQSRVTEQHTENSLLAQQIISIKSELDNYSLKKKIESSLILTNR